MSSLSIACPGCQRQLVFPDHSVVGKTARCPECGRRFPIEAAVEAGLPEIEVSESPVIARNRGRKSSGSGSATPSSPRPARVRPAWLPLAITALLGVTAVALLLVLGGGDEGNPDAGGAAAVGTGGADDRSGGAEDPEPAVALPAAAHATGTIRVGLMVRWLT